MSSIESPRCLLDSSWIRISETLGTLGVPDFLSVFAALLVRTRVPKRAFFYWITSFSKLLFLFLSLAQMKRIHCRKKRINSPITNLNLQINLPLIFYLTTHYLPRPITYLPIIYLPTFQLAKYIFMYLPSYLLTYW